MTIGEKVKRGPGSAHPRQYLNAQIAAELGWRIWEDPRNHGRWFQERDGKPGFTEAMPVLDYIDILENDLKMKTGDRRPVGEAGQEEKK